MLLRFENDGTAIWVVSKNNKNLRGLVEKILDRIDGKSFYLMITLQNFTYALIVFLCTFRGNF